MTYTLLWARQAPSVMNTSVNSDTWISVGIRMPATANDELPAYIIPASAMEMMNSSVPSAADLVAASMAQTTSAPHIAKPNHEALSIRATAMARVASAT